MFRPVGRNIELNSEEIGAKSAVASYFIYEIRELRRHRVYTHGRRRTNVCSYTRIGSWKKVNTIPREEKPVFDKRFDGSSHNCDS